MPFGRKIAAPTLESLRALFADCIALTKSSVASPACGTIHGSAAPVVAMVKPVVMSSPRRVAYGIEVSPLYDVIVIALKRHFQCQHGDLIREAWRPATGISSGQILIATDHGDAMIDLVG